MAYSLSFGSCYTSRFWFVTFVICDVIRPSGGTITANKYVYRNFSIFTICGEYGNSMIFCMIFCIFPITSKTGKPAGNNINIQICIIAALQQVIQAPTLRSAPVGHVRSRAKSMEPKTYGNHCRNRPFCPFSKLV